MKIQHHVLLILLMATGMLSATNSIAYSPIIDDEEKQENCTEPYVIPCIMGGVVGFISGKISRNICAGSFTLTLATALGSPLGPVNKVRQGIIGLVGLSVIIGTLIAENKLRAKCIDRLNQEFECCGIKPNNLAKNSARVLSWITFVGIL